MRDEDTEPGEDDGGELRQSELRATLDPRNLSVGEHVAEVGDDLTGQREGNPDQVGMREPVDDIPEAGGPGDGHGRAHGEGDAERDEEDELPCGVVEMALRPEARTEDLIFGEGFESTSGPETMVASYPVGATGNPGRRRLATSGRPVEGRGYPGYTRWR